ncbi:hypothetical protein [Campylobacter sp. CCUG 57310]|uniref:hypothetical protein n=1 Tax=Campylobacter sp. CCUG 57310 TaxID=2517362 RepID=UPI0015638193|nr:hypothetical protein [Campylobacter sp. CCUG 57310]QKF92930.1 hypothetical protein CORI_1765 [Campylobacter sp. CCUG 57310]
MRLYPANLDIVFEEILDRKDEFAIEFDKLSGSEDDPLGQWLKRAKARGETKESDQVLLTLITELHRKFDELNAYLKNEKISKLELNESSVIEGIGFENFSIKEAKFKPNNNYYARISMPIFPKRDVAIYFEAVDEKTAKITKMHESDESDYNGYVTARERVMIRELKGTNG